MTSSLEARFNAIAKLQAIRERHAPGSRRYEQVEHAIDLALGERRAVDQFLVRNLLRDAQRVIERQVARRTIVELPQDEEALILDVLVEYETPESRLQALQIANEILITVSRSSRHAKCVLEGLIQDEAMSATATRACISVARVNQLRQSLRDEARCHLESPWMPKPR